MSRRDKEFVVGCLLAIIGAALFVTSVTFDLLGYCFALWLTCGILGTVCLILLPIRWLLK